jgi:predicted small lipoprotein YifL
MRKMILLLALAAAACGVKSDLQHPNGDQFPRSYPTE